jgi:hypothetical protein
MFYVQRTRITETGTYPSIVHKSNTLSGAVRKMNGLEAKQKKISERYDEKVEFIVLNEAEYEHTYGQMVQRTNIMSGKTYWERKDTPGYMSPASEAYWSM